MSWAVEEWKEGLPTRTLQKIQEIESQLDKLKKERQQRQFQLESVEAALLKQKHKVEHEKNEACTLKREHQSLIESCENLEKTKQRISHELQVKESQVNYLEGQLASSKKHIESLEQENKRYKNELERCQQSIKSEDVQNKSPQRTFSRSVTPSQNADDSKLEKLQEKYHKEVEERRRLEAELKLLQVKTNQTQAQGTISHRDIARQQTSSSIFPWQQEQTPSQVSSRSMETPLKRGSAPLNLQWDLDEWQGTKSVQKTAPSKSQFNDGTNSFKHEEQLKSQNQELKAKVSELELRIQAQEKEVKNDLNRQQEIQLQFEKTKADLSEKVHNLNKCRDELNRVITQHEQVTDKCAILEQKLKQVSDELSCQRQNADSTRRNMEQKLRDKEKEYQKEFACQQQSLQSLDLQFNQMKNKLNQELQQAKNSNDATQSEIDKVSVHRRKLEEELDEIKLKLCCTEQLLQANQIKENDLKKKLEDIMKERNGLRSQFDQSSIRVLQLDDELKKSKHDLNICRSYGEEMKDKTNAQEAELKALREKLDEQSRSISINIDNLNQTVSALKLERDSVLKTLKESEKSKEQLNVQIGAKETKMEELQKALHLKEEEFQELKEEYDSLGEWKTENVCFVDNFKQEKQGLVNKIEELEQNLYVSQRKSKELEQTIEVDQNIRKEQSVKQKLLEDERENLQRQTDDLNNLLNSKAVELETQKQALEELTKRTVQEEQKHSKDVENLRLNISQLTSLIVELEKNLQHQTKEVETLEESREALIAEYEDANNLAKSKDSLIELKETEILNLRDSFSQTIHNLEQRLTNVEAEKASLIDEHESNSLEKADEVESLKLLLEKYQHNTSFLKDQIVSLESSLKLQKHLGSQLQNQCEALLKLKGELDEKVKEAEIKQAEMNQEIKQLDLACSAQQQHAEALEATFNDKDKSIQKFAEELEIKISDSKCLQETIEELEIKLEEAHLQSEKFNEEKVELIHLKVKELEKVLEESQKLKDTINILTRKNMELNEKNSSFEDAMKVNEAKLLELTTKHEETKVTENLLKELKKRCVALDQQKSEVEEKNKMLENTAELKDNEIKQLLEKMSEVEAKEHGLLEQYTECEGEVRGLRQKCSALEENKDSLEVQVCEQSKELLNKNVEMEELESKYQKDCAEYTANISAYDEKIKGMIEKLENLQSDIKNTEAINLEEKSKVNDMKKELNTSNAAKSKLQEDYNKLFQEKKHLEHLVTEQVNELKGLRAAQTENEIAFTAKMKRLEYDLNIAHSEDVKSSELIAEKNLSLNRLNSVIEEKETELQKRQVQLQLLQMDLEELEGSLESHGLQTEKMQADLNNIQNKCQCSEEQRALLQKDLSAVQAEMEAMCLKFSASVNREESLVDQIAVQEQAIEKLRSDLEKRKEQEFVLVRSLENLQHQCNESQTKYKLKAEEECLKVAEILELKDKLFLCQSELSNSITRNSDLESKLDSVQQESKVQMQTALNNMETTIQQGEEQRELLQKNLSEVHSELEGMHLKFSENKNHKESLMKQVALQSLTIEDLKSELKESKEQEVVLLSSLENTQSQFTESQIKAEEEHQLREKEILELNQLKERNATLVTEIEATQSKLDMIKLEKLELVKLLESSMLQKGEVEAKLNSTRAELDSLKQQYSSEIEEWQLKLSNLTTEMECKLAVEKQQTQLLLKGLESARIQLHSLNLCSQSLCDSDLDADDTPQKQPDSKEQRQQRELTRISGQLQFNCNILSPESKVYHRRKSNLQTCIAIEETPVFCNDSTISLDQEIDRTSNNLKVELEESHWEQKCTIDQIQFDSHESLCDQVEHSPTQVGDVSQTQFEQESGKMVNEMLSEIESFRSSLDTQQKQLVSRTTACNELEKKVMLLEEEKHCLCNELNSSVVENQNLSEKIKDLEDELSNNTLQQQVDKVKLSDVTKMLESLEMAKESWNEKVLELENALKRAKSDKANLEKHILEMEVDLDKMQIRKDTLEKEVESNQKITTDQEEILTDLKTKNTRISWELNTLAEVNDELEKTNQSLKVKVQELEADKIYSTNTNRVLEADTKKLTEQLQSATEQMEKISREKKDLMHQLQNLEENTMSDTTRNKQQLKQLTEGNATLVTEIEAVQSKLDMIKLEKLELVKLLESSMLEKGEIATRLNSTQAEVAEMRHAIEKLKVRIEADQKKSQFVAEKLKASDRKADSLQDRIETLERELQVAEENLEDMVLQAETAKEQSEVLEEENKTITEKLATLSMELNTISSEKEDLKKQLQQNQEKLEELEIHFSETDEIERNKMAKTYENSVGELQSKISHLNKQIDVCNGELEKLRVKEEDWLDHTSCLEREKAQLIQQLQEAERLNEELRSVDMTLNKDLKVVQQHLGEHIQEKGRLQQQVIDLEQWKQEVSKEMSNLQDEKANFDEKKNNLQVALTEAQQSKQDLAAKNEIIQVTLETLENSEKRLKNELEIARSQSSALQNQVAEFRESYNKLENDLSKANEKIVKVHQEFDAEKKVISTQLEDAKRQVDSFKLQIEIFQSEKINFEKEIGCLQTELKTTEKLRKEVEEHKWRLQHIQEEHQTVLKECQDQHESGAQSYQQKITGMEQQLAAQDVEISNLKLTKEELNTALKEASCKLKQFSETKVDELQSTMAKLKKDKASAQNKLFLWMRNCKQLEQEKESLKKYTEQQDELITKLQKSPKQGSDSLVDDLRTELKELRESLEEKTNEADENIEKYWNLIKNSHTLEEENEMLKNRVEMLGSHLQQSSSQSLSNNAEQNVLPPSKSTVCKSNENKLPGQSSRQLKQQLKSLDDSCVASEEGLSKSQEKSPTGQPRHPIKRNRGAESKKETDEQKPGTWSKRTRSGNTPGASKSAAHSDHVHQPEALPGVIKKGSGDFPSVSPSPYVLRRTTVLNRACSQITPQSQLQHKQVVQTSAMKVKTTAEGRSVKVQHQAEATCSSAASIPVTTADSPLLSLANSTRKSSFDIIGGKREPKGRRSMSTKKSPEQKLQQRQVAMSQEDENCKVQ
eukprot:gi/632973582/ref/XP_007903223.1/ PREDICTED: centromere protein F isoform X2 [Callorhinchus milii]